MKRANLLIMAGVLVMSITGCTSIGEESDGSSIMEPIEQNTDGSGQITDDQITDGNQAANNETAGDNGAAAGDSLEGLIAGQNTLSFKYYKNNVFNNEVPALSYEDEVIAHIDTDKEYTLSEFKDALNTLFHDSEKWYIEGDVESMEYAYIDCGADGVKEMALRLTGPFVEPSSSMTYIIKEIDSKLEVVYAYAEWARSETSVNEYGFITGGGSGGASLHVYDAACIDANGKYQFGFYEEEEASLEQFGYLREHADFDATSLDGTLCVYSLRLDPSTETDYEPQFYSYDVYDSNYDKMNVPNLYTDSQYKTVMDSFKGITFITMDELKQKEDEKLKSIGVTDQIKNGAAPTFTKI